MLIYISRFFFVLLEGSRRFFWYGFYVVFEPKKFKNRMDVFMQSYFFFWWLKKRTVKSDQKFSKKTQKKKSTKKWPKILMEPTFLFKLLKLIRSSIFDPTDYPLIFLWQLRKISNPFFSKKLNPLVWQMKNIVTPFFEHWSEN